MRVLLLSLLLMGCSTLNPDTYRAQQPTFDLFEFFDGQVTAYGIVQNRAGQVIQRFEVDIRGAVQDNVLTLDEDFVYTLGEGPGNRIWTIERQGEAILGSATDVPGPALGESYGNTFRFRYTMDLPVGDTQYAVNFDDWFYAMDDQRIFNRSQIKKFGLTFAEVTIFMQRD